MGCKGCLEGAVKLAKAAVGMDKADDVTISARRDICRECPKSEKRMSNQGRLAMTKFSACQQCGCFITAKTRLASEACPVDKWPAIALPVLPPESVQQSPVDSSPL